MLVLHKRLAATCIVLSSLAVLPLRAQSPPPPPSHPTSTPYTGDLSIFEDPGRDQKLQTGRVMDALKLHPGSVIADIGAGGGWFSVRAAKRVAPGGEVIAEDINPKAVETIADRAKRENLPDIHPLLGTPDDPRLAPNSLNAALMLRVYHEVAHPPILLAHLREAMKPGALFGVIDHPGRGDDHGINPDVVKAEVKAAGFRFVAQYDFPHADQGDYMLVFAKR
jgi:predicted methyltransferase